MRRIISIFEKRLKYHITNNQEETLNIDLQHGDVVMVEGKPKIVRKTENTPRGDYLVAFADGTQVIFVYYNKRDPYDFLGEWKILKRGR